MKNKIFLLILFVFILIFLVSCTANQSTPHGKSQRDLYVLKDPSIGPWDSTHDHTALFIFINGDVFDLSKPEYMIRARRVHIEGLDGTIIHKHATGITIGHFLESLGFNFDNNCLDVGQNNYCNDDKNKLQFFVNGKPNKEFNNYIFRNDDRLLISYGGDNDEVVNQQLNILNDIEIY